MPTTTDHRLGAGGDGGGAADDGAEALRCSHHLVAGEEADHGIALRRGGRGGADSEGDGGGGVAAVRLADDVGGRQLGKLAPGGGGELRGGDDEDVLRAGDPLQPRHRLADQALAAEDAQDQLVNGFYRSVELAAIIAYELG